MKTRILLSGLCLISLANMSAQTPAGKSWDTDPTWLETRYGAWGGPGVNPAPGPMDGMLLKDYAPASSVMVPETIVAKAKFPVIDVHSHASNGRTPEEVAAWVRTM